jgi:glycosyltransferase involved in cell wall biosynthesis
MPSAFQPKPDVCLLLEGTYPYVSGGVSTWVHQIINSLPELQFSLFFIGSEKAANIKFKYTLPPNIISVEEIYLHEPGRPSAGRLSGAGQSAAAEMQQLLRRLLFDHPSPAEETHLLLDVARHVRVLEKSSGLDAFWNAQGTWDLVCDAYEKFAEGESFLDFYWSVRALCEPVWKLLVACDRIPPARMYHSLCTGYAGFAAGVAAMNFESAYLLSEHGIYVRERVAELQKARWIHDPPVIRPSLHRDPAVIRRLWIGFFRLLGRFAYQTSNYITSLFEKNAQTQVEFGADPRRIEIIPNGIQPADFYPIRGRRRAKRQLAGQRRNVGFMGRVVQIKDVKTLLKCARLVIDRLPDVAFLIAGPTDEEPQYAQECRTLARHLNLEEHVSFLGTQKVEEFLPELDVMLLTSLSEGLPFVVLESYAAGVPLVSTDVGACRELIEGRPDENPRLGPAGLVASVGNAEALADALVAILSNPPLAQQMGETGRLRVEQHYSRDKVVQRYRQLYQLSPKDFTRSGLRPQAALASAAAAASSSAAPALAGAGQG